MKKTESLMGNGTLQQAKAGLFGSAKSFEVKYQFQLETENEGGVGQLKGFLRIDEKQKLANGGNYVLVLDDQRKGKITIGKAVAQVGGIITYSINGETIV